MNDNENLECLARARSSVGGDGKKVNDAENVEINSFSVFL